MVDKEYLRRIYRHFADFIAIAASRELEYFVMDSKFTTAFNSRMKKIVQDIKREGKSSIELSILFNTDEEIVLIDADILGRFISNNFNLTIGQYYKETSLNKIVKKIVNGNEKVQKDFMVISYKILYNILQEMYKEIKCKKDSIQNLRQKFALEQYSKDDISIKIAVLLILEDIAKYIGIPEKVIKYISNFNED